jgi:hypothetical protein
MAMMQLWEILVPIWVLKSKKFRKGVRFNLTRASKQVTEEQHGA